MSMTDPIADMLVRIKNAQAVGHKSVRMPASKVKKAIADVLQDEGYIASSKVIETGPKRDLEIELRYYEGAPVIERLERYSKPGLRQYRSREDIPSVRSGLGVAIVSTSAGIMTDRAAREQGIGGEVLCLVA